MSTREKLLKRWAELEPERCNAEHGLVLIKQAPVIPGYEAMWHGIGTPGVILAGILEGIGVHGWQIAVYNLGPIWAAALIRPEVPRITDYEYRADNHDVEDAALDAYVKALEAAKTSADTK